MNKNNGNAARRNRPTKKTSSRSVPATQGQAIAMTDALVHPLDLTSGFRDRLIASLDQAGVPPRGRMAYVAALTCRAVQTVSRWLDPNRPGLPDLESCARLCEGLGRSSDWMLGLAPKPCRCALSAGVVSVVEVDWAREIFDALRGDATACDVVRMAGDEMVPTICDGDLVFVDRAADGLAGNGIYALEVDGRLMVRRIESRLGTGLVVKCENPGYQEYVVKDAATAKRAGLRVIGKVRGAVGVARFWND
jgi:hypothetical protein